MAMPFCNGINPYWKNEQPQARPIVRHKYKGLSFMDILMKYRYLVIIPVVLPLSFLWGKINNLLAWLANLRREKTSRALHDRRVERVQNRIRARNPEKDGLICTARRPMWSISMRPVEYKTQHRYAVDLSDLRDVVAIDKERMLAYVEPGVNMAVLSSALLPHGLCVPVLPEYEDLTVGGLVIGYGIEGSSHIYGLFADTLESADVILADGTLAHCTRDNEYSDLFHALPWSYGALGMLVGVEIRLIPAKPYMRVTYVPIRGTVQEMADAYHQLLVPEDRPWAEYVEGLIFNSTTGVVTIADYASEQEARASGAINTMGLWYKRWFHHYAHDIVKEQAARNGAPYTEYVPTRDYFLRHTRSLYWMADLLVPMGNHWIFRYLLGWLMPPRVSFLKLSMTPAMSRYYNSKFVAQDILVPAAKTGPCMELMHDLFEIYPLWLCAHKVIRTGKGTMLDVEPGYNDREQHQQGDSADAQMYVDIGIWQTPTPILRGEEYNLEGAVDEMEAWLIKNHGFQALYAITQLSESDFWRMYDKTLYSEMRKKYGGEGSFFDVFTKVGMKR